MLKLFACTLVLISTASTSAMRIHNSSPLVSIFGATLAPAIACFYSWDWIKSAEQLAQLKDTHTKLNSEMRNLIWNSKRDCIDDRNEDKKD